MTKDRYITHISFITSNPTLSNTIRLDLVTSNIPYYITFDNSDIISTTSNDNKVRVFSKKMNTLISGNEVIRLSFSDGVEEYISYPKDRYHNYVTGMYSVNGIHPATLIIDDK